MEARGLAAPKTHPVEIKRYATFSRRCYFSQDVSSHLWKRTIIRDDSSSETNPV